MIVNVAADYNLSPPSHNFMGFFEAAHKQQTQTGERLNYNQNNNWPDHSSSCANNFRTSTTKILGVKLVDYLATKLMIDMIHNNPLFSIVLGVGV